MYAYKKTYGTFSKIRRRHFLWLDVKGTGVQVGCYLYTSEQQGAPRPAFCSVPVIWSNLPGLNSLACLWPEAYLVCSLIISWCSLLIPLGWQLAPVLCVEIGFAILAFSISQLTHKCLGNLFLTMFLSVAPPRYHSGNLHYSVPLGYVNSFFSVALLGEKPVMYLTE